MTDDIKVGDRFLVEVEVTGHGVGQWVWGRISKGYTYSFTASFLSTCQRLPPEIAVGDWVDWTDNGSVPATFRGNVEAIAGDWTLVANCGGIKPVRLSDLTLVKKAET